MDLNRMLVGVVVVVAVVAVVVAWGWGGGGGGGVFWYVINSNYLSILQCLT